MKKNKYIINWNLPEWKLHEGDWACEKLFSIQNVAKELSDEELIKILNKIAKVKLKFKKNGDPF